MIIKLLISLIKFYRWIISPYLMPRCRFEPTCSRYAIHSLQHHGFKRGSWLIMKRLMKCQPFQRLGGSWGYDPVPDTMSQIK